MITEDKLKEIIEDVKSLSKDSASLHEIEATLICNFVTKRTDGIQIEVSSGINMLVKVLEAYKGLVERI